MTTWLICLKGFVHTNIFNLSSFTHPHVIPNLFEYLSSTVAKRAQRAATEENTVTLPCTVQLPM